MIDLREHQLKRAFIICPVRNITPEFQASIEAHVAHLESLGWVVHYPPRDTAQAGVTEFSICNQNRNAINRADMVFVFWDGKSQGCLFDLGIAFGLHKPVKVYSAPRMTREKSFQNFMRDLEEREPWPPYLNHRDF